MKITFPERRDQYASEGTHYFGADPEFFFRDQDGNVVTSDLILKPGEKYNIMPGGMVSPYISQHHEIFCDGAQAELNWRSSSCREHQVTYLGESLAAVHKKWPDYTVSCDAAVKLTKTQIKQADPIVNEFGCNPDFNAYTGDENKYMLEANHPWRYAGGHIHFSTTDLPTKKPEEILNFVKLLDLVVGVPCRLIDRGKLTKRRARYYGRAGCFRPREGGVEYRSLSNFWMRAPELHSLALGLVRLAIRIRVNSLDHELFKVVPEKTVRRALDSHSLKRLERIWNDIKFPLAMASIHDTDPLSPALRDRGQEYAPDMDGLAAFEWLRTKDIDKTIGSVKHAWLNGGNGSRYTYGSGFRKLMNIRLKRSKEFKKFHEEFSLHNPAQRSADALKSDS